MKDCLILGLEVTVALLAVDMIYLLVKNRKKTHFITIEHKYPKNEDMTFSL